MVEEVWQEILVWAVLGPLEVLGLELLEVLAGRPGIDLVWVGIVQVLADQRMLVVIHCGRQ